MLWLSGAYRIRVPPATGFRVSVDFTKLVVYVVLFDVCQPTKRIDSMKTKSPIIALLMVLSFSVLAQDKVREQIFLETDQLMAEAKKKGIELYSPGNTAKALEAYREAEDAYRKGENLEEIRGKLRTVTGHLWQAMETTKLGEVTFSNTVAARNDAMSADAPKYSQEIWKKAEAGFVAATRELEDGDVQDARKEASAAETLYRNAELEAIKTNFLAPARSLIQRADAMDVKENAPKTIERARQLASQAEALLKQNRYDTDEAREFARLSKYEAEHSIYLHNAIQKMKASKQTFEDALLAAEEPLQKVAGTMGLSAAFDQGMEPPTKTVTTELQKRDSAARQNAALVQRRDVEVKTLKQQIALMEGRLGTLTDAEQKLKQNLATEKSNDETIAQVATMFTSDEASVSREGKSVVISLHGLIFASGSGVVEPQHHAILDKTIAAIRKYPKCQLVVEGHTDSQGSDGANMAVSEERATSVGAYIRANLHSTVSISTFGYGETKPVGSNETPEGRARNRRVDVTIVPEWVIVGR